MSANLIPCPLEPVLGWWAEKQCRVFMGFALFIHPAQYAASRYCALPR
ncbi:MAG: hypothetical protein WCI11_18300 [Candidatus Methylumidiphilus sp.]